MLKNSREEGSRPQITEREQNASEKGQAEGDPIEIYGVRQAETQGIEENGRSESGKYSAITVEEKGAEDDLLGIGGQKGVQYQENEPGGRPEPRKPKK